MSDTYSYSRVSTYESCPYQYKCRYIDKLAPITDNEADNALLVGTAMHEAIEGMNWRENYLSQLCISSDKAEEEQIKIETLSLEVREYLTEHFSNLEFEHEINTPDGYIGYIDCIATDDNGEKWIIDFKYSNSEYYLKSPQVHIYKSIYPVDHIAYLMIPKILIRLKKTETVAQFRQQLDEELSKAEIRLVEVEFNPLLVDEFYQNVRAMKGAKEFPKNENKLCDWCDFKKLCKEGEDIMLIPKNEKVAVEKNTLKKVYLYGTPFSGKTYLANQFEDALMLNSDGNTKFVDSPRIHICDVVTMDGRIEKRKLAWEVFKDVITELEHGDGKEYKTIVVDLLEDMYEYCRLYMYKQLKITHESDDNFRAWDKVRQEFLGTIKRLIALPFNIVLISQEDTSKDITARGGDKVTAIAPALTEKVARKIAGMVDIVLRVVNDGGVYTLQNKPSDVVFGGGRFTLEKKEYPSEYASIREIYKENN